MRRFLVIELEQAGDALHARLTLAERHWDAKCLCLDVNYPGPDVHDNHVMNVNVDGVKISGLGIDFETLADGA